VAVCASSCAKADTETKVKRTAKTAVAKCLMAVFIVEIITVFQKSGANIKEYGSLENERKQITGLSGLK